MKNRVCFSLITFLISIVINIPAFAIEEKIQSAIDKMVIEAQTLAKDSEVVNYVKEINKNGNPIKDMTQKKWSELASNDSIFSNLRENKAALMLKKFKNKQGLVSELFLNAADGTKAALVSRTTNWSHKDKPKHEVPMKGKTWQGEIEIDESSLSKQIQFSIPVLDGTTPIGSLVVGLNVTKI